MKYRNRTCGGKVGIALLIVASLTMRVAGNDVPVEQLAWSAQKPMIEDGAIRKWVLAPEFLKWRAADPGEDGFAGRVLRVNLSGLFHSGAWSQHAGALYTLPRTISKGEPFTLHFMARSLEGAGFLTVLRTWGGAKPWESIPISSEWKDYAITLTPGFATERVTFSLVPKSGGLQPYAAGTFELYRVRLEK